MSGTPAVTAVLQDSPYLVQLSDDLGHTWPADEPQEVGGGNTGPAPDRLILGGLGACTAITIKMVAARRNWPLTGVRVELQLNPDGKPESGNDIVRRVFLEGALSEEQRAQLLKIANACPMHKLLTGEVRIHTDLG
ncbi:MAG: OsmC family protein [Zoogloea sp.]|nr:OsmC family protein [Zoogloea sp.]MCA0186850.1 OsmC family protein [Pseudomonadota bacterium]